MILIKLLVAKALKRFLACSLALKMEIKKTSGCMRLCINKMVNWLAIKTRFL